MSGMGVPADEPLELCENLGCPLQKEKRPDHDDAEGGPGAPVDPLKQAAQPPRPGVANIWMFENPRPSV